ncbi:MAG: 3-hydroxyacyl-CoA dehydrogenase family protein, partial [Desulfocucumaceae bacterium]
TELLIEAIVEKLDVKQAFWMEIGKNIKDGALLATNTSGLSISEISKYIRQKSQFAGMHWWNPPHIVPLVEIIRGEETSDETISKLMKIAEELGKKAVLVRKEAPGFIGNRLQFAVFREAIHIVEQGIASPEDVDKAFKSGPGFRYATKGPIETADLGGLDTFSYISSYLFKQLNNSGEPADILRRLVENNCLGIKTGKGFYDYSNHRDQEVLYQRDRQFLKMLKLIVED